MTRLNQFIASSSGLSRRAADDAIMSGRVDINGRPAGLGVIVQPGDAVTLDGQRLRPHEHLVIALHKPVGYVCSRQQQGSSPTIYALLPPAYAHLESVGRLDKDSSGLLLLTNDGELTHSLTHPSAGKIKLYQVEVSPTPTPQLVAELGLGVTLADGPSRMAATLKGRQLTIRLSEGRNRQIRRTLEALGYTVTRLHRTHFGDIALGQLAPGHTRVITSSELA